MSTPSPRPSASRRDFLLGLGAMPVGAAARGSPPDDADDMAAAARLVGLEFTPEGRPRDCLSLTDCSGAAWISGYAKIYLCSRSETIRAFWTIRTLHPLSVDTIPTPWEASERP